MKKALGSRLARIFRNLGKSRRFMKEAKPECWLVGVVRVQSCTPA